MSATMTYAPVAAFELVRGGEKLQGFAAPSGGPAPCLVKLTAGETPIAFAQAGRFSAAAAAAGLRLGWCGFDIPGVRQAFAIASEVTLSCGVSGETLATIPFDPALFEGGQPAESTLSVIQLLTLARDGEMAEDIAHILPFALAHLRRHGARALIEASYQTLLRRWPDGDANMNLHVEEGQTDEDAVAAHLGNMAGSAEHNSQVAPAIPGPFHQAFRYDRAVLGT